MRFLGVPSRDFLLNLALTVLIASLFFWPALASFGHVLLGAEDIRFFIWSFWHFENSIESGKNPFFANEIFYPYGVSLSLSTTALFQSVIYFLLPSAWGAFGKITSLQMLSFVLGGIFSFALVYRYTRSFLPSFAGSVIFNLSVYHFEKALHHLNYSMAFPFLALFFYSYFEMAEGKDKRKTDWDGIALISISLLLLALNEMTVAVMAGFIVFIDIIRRCMWKKGRAVMTVKNVLLLAAAVALALMLHEVSWALSLPSFLIYTIPAIPFLSVCFLMAGPSSLFKDEQGILRALSISAIPTGLYLAFLLLQPSYPSEPSYYLASLMKFTVPVEYLIIPSDFQAISHLGLFKGLAAGSEGGVYLGIPLALLFLTSILVGKASDEEISARDSSILCLFLSFPVILVGSFIFLPTPFMVEPAFPLLGVLRVPVRFMLFTFLFASIMAGLAMKRLLPDGRSGKIIAAIIILLLLFERWPESRAFVFDSDVPKFYAELAKDNSSHAIFFYPGINYYSALQEIYFQTIHGKNLSYGVLSRSPTGGNPLFSLYNGPGIDQSSSGKVVRLAHDLGYDYLVVEKKSCRSNCFYDASVPLDVAYLKSLGAELEKDAGKPVFEDERMIVYGLKR